MADIRKVQGKICERACVGEESAYRGRIGNCSESISYDRDWRRPKKWENEKKNRLTDKNEVMQADIFVQLGLVDMPKSWYNNRQ